MGVVRLIARLQWLNLTIPPYPSPCKGEGTGQRVLRSPRIHLNNLLTPLVRTKLLDIEDGNGAPIHLNHLLDHEIMQDA